MYDAGTFWPKFMQKRKNWILLWGGGWISQLKEFSPQNCQNFYFCKDRNWIQRMA